jgi:methyltransferase (TIGR00027 family)
VEKRARLAAAGLVPPDNVTFAGIDFEHETLAEGLRRHGVQRDQPAFFSWLGVTMYLTAAAVDATLQTVAGFPGGSEIVFTFAPRETGLFPTGAQLLAAGAAAMGEPWLTYFEPAELEQKLRGMGFDPVTFLSPQEAAVRYFSAGPEGLPPPRRGTIVSARKG